MKLKTLLLPLGLLAASSSALAGPITSSVVLDPVAEADDPLAVFSQGATLNPLGGSLTATGADGATATTQINASWTDAGNGTVSFTDSWAGAEGAIGEMDFGFDSGGFFYEFIADGTGIFSVDYVVSASGSQTFGNQPFRVALDAVIAFTGDTNDAGTFNFNVIAGQSYVFQISNLSNLSGSLGNGADLLKEGTFNFSGPIRSGEVPLPGTIALLGLGLVGLAGSRRRKA
jgi:hypothetical protein